MGHFCCQYRQRVSKDSKVFIAKTSIIDDPDRCLNCYNKQSREISAYRDPVTGQFLNSWTNTLTGKVNEVRPVLNDPVNSQQGTWTPQFQHSKNDPTKFTSNDAIFLKYPNHMADESYDDYW